MISRGPGGPHSSAAPRLRLLRAMSRPCCPWSSRHLHIVVHDQSLEVVEVLEAMNLQVDLEVHESLMQRFQLQVEVEDLMHLESILAS